MKKKIMGIFVCTLLILTALPAFGAMNVNVKQENMQEDICGTAIVVLKGGNETAKQGATVRFYTMLLCNLIRLPGVYSDVKVFQVDDPEDPLFGEYIAIFEGCGCYQIEALRNKGWCGKYVVNHIVENFLTKTIEIPWVVCKIRDRIPQQHSYQLLLRSLTKLFDHFPILARLF